MDREEARKILGSIVEYTNRLYCLGHYIAWDVGAKTITLDSEFTLEELEAIVWWMKNNG